MKNYVAVFLVGGAIGYFLMPKKEVVKTVEKQVDRVVTVIKRPDGTIEKVTTDKSKINVDETTKLNSEHSKYSLSALVGVGSEPKYGLHVSKELLGPVTVGAWGLAGAGVSNLQLGLSFGVNF